MLRAGCRVRLHAPSPVLTLASPCGTVIGPDPKIGGYWLVQLDEPAASQHGAGAYELSVIREHADNLTVIAAHRTNRTGRGLVTAGRVFAVEGIAMPDPLSALQKALHSCEYPCPGGHRLDGVRGDRYDFVDETMDEMGLPSEWGDDDLSVEHPEEWKALLAKMSENWVEPGHCTQTVEITLEYDGEYGEYSYPVAEGPCAAALGMDEDEDYSHPLWQRAFERWSLEKILCDACRTEPALELP